MKKRKKMKEYLLKLSKGIEKRVLSFVLVLAMAVSLFQTAAGSLLTVNAAENYAITIHFLNSGNWDEVAAYAKEGDSWENIGSDEDSKAYGTWPGKVISENADHENWYDLVISKANKNALHFIFNNNDHKAQTDNLLWDYSSDATEVWCKDNKVLTTAPSEWTGAPSEEVPEDDSLKVTDYVQLKIGENTYDMDVYMNGVFESKVELAKGEYAASVLVNGKATEATSTVKVDADKNVYFRYADGTLINSISDAATFHTAALVGNFNGIEFVDGEGTRYDIASWKPSDANGDLTYYGGGLFGRTFQFKTLANDVTLADGGYKIAFDDDDKWKYSFGNGGDNIALTIPAGSTQLTVLVDEINQKVYDSVRTPDFIAKQNDGEYACKALATTISLIGPVRENDTDNWNAKAEGYEFTQISDTLFRYQKHFAAGSYEYKCVFNYEKWYEAEGSNRKITLADDAEVVFLYDTATGLLYDSVNNADKTAELLGMQAAPAEPAKAEVITNGNASTTFQTIAENKDTKVTLTYGNKAEVAKSGDAALTTVALKCTDEKQGVFQTDAIFFGDAAVDVVYYYTVNGEKKLDGSATKVTVGEVDYSSYTREAFTGRLVCVPGTFPGPSWDAASNEMSYQGKGLYRYTFKKVPAANYQYKIAMGSWDIEEYGAGGKPKGDNCSVTVPSDQDVTIYYNDFSHIMVDSISYVFAYVTLTGTGIPAETMLTDSGLTGIYSTTVSLKAGTYSDVKIIYGGTEYAFDSFTLANDKEVTFCFDPSTEIYYSNASEVAIDTEHIKYDSKDSTYKAPFGAVATGENVTFTITTGTDATKVNLYVKGIEKKNVTMKKSGEAVDGVQKWTATTSFAKLGEYQYFFAISAGSSVKVYADDDGFYGTGKVCELTELDPYDLVVYKSGYETPDWMKNAVVYQIFPDRFFDGDESNNQAQTSARGEEDYEYIKDWYTLPENPEQEGLLTKEEYEATGAYYGDGNWSNEIYGGDLEGITDRIEYLKALGVTVIYLNPVFSSISSHRYDTSDYNIVDPILGDLGDFEELVEVAKANDMHIVLDGVFNHVSDDSKYFDRYYKYLEAGTDTIGAYPYWAYVYDYMKDKNVDQTAAEKAAKAYFTENYGIKDYSYTTWFDIFKDKVLTGDDEQPVKDNIGQRAGKEVYNYDGWWGYDSMPVIKSTNGSEFQTGDWADEIIGNDEKTSVTQYWLEKGSDGWRLDVANEVSDETWQEFRQSVKALDDDYVIIGEIWDDATKYLLGDMYDSVMNYVFRDAVLAYAKGGASADTMNTLEKLRERYPEEAFYAMMNLVGSHDTTRVLSYLNGTNDDRKQTDVANAFPTYENTSDLAKKQQYLVAFMQFTYAGAPTIYYGDEIGMVGADDPDDRRAFEWGKGNKELVTWYATLANIRSKYSALRTGTVEPFSTNSDSILSYVRSDNKNTMIVLANNKNEEQSVTIDLAEINVTGTAFTDLISSESYKAADGKLVVTVPALSGAILTTNAKSITVNQSALAPAYDPAYVIAARKDAEPEQPTDPKPEQPADPKPEQPAAPTVTVDWDKEVEAIKDAGNSESITINIGEAGVVKKEALEAFKGTDKKVTFDLGNGIKWTIKGTDIDKVPEKELVLDVKMNTTNVPEDVIKNSELAKEDVIDTLQISLGADGALGLIGTMTLPVGKEFAGKYANLYYYDPETKELKGRMSALVNENGEVDFLFNHASDYVISITDKATLTTSPNMGDQSQAANYLLILALGAVCVAAAMRKRKTIVES